MSEKGRIWVVAVNRIGIHVWQNSSKSQGNTINKHQQIDCGKTWKQIRKKPNIGGGGKIDARAYHNSMPKLLSKNHGNNIKHVFLFVKPFKFIVKTIASEGLARER